MKTPSLSFHIELTVEELEQLERFAALGYEPSEMAVLLLKEEELFCKAAEDPGSKVNYHIRRGKLLAVAREEMNILASAELGNLDASARLEEIRRTRKFEISKADIFAGFEDTKSFQKLEDFIESGGKSSLSADEQIYLEALTMMNSMDRKFGRRKTIVFFTKEPFNLSLSRASEMFDEAVNLFFSDRRMEKKAMRNKKAELLEEYASAAFKMAKTVRDLEVAGNLQMQAAKLLELDKPDPAKLPSELYRKQVRLFTIDPELVGIPGINRQQLAEQIDELDIPASDRDRIRQDALIEDLKFEEQLNELAEKG